jgi:hypothetical protein
MLGCVSQNVKACVIYKMRYRLQRMLGPVKMPSQNIRFPRVAWFRSHLVRLSLTNLKKDMLLVDIAVQRRG